MSKTLLCVCSQDIFLALFLLKIVLKRLVGGFDLISEPVRIRVKHLDSVLLYFFVVFVVVVDMIVLWLI